MVVHLTMKSKKNPPEISLLPEDENSKFPLIREAVEKIIFLLFFPLCPFVPYFVILCV